MLLSFPWPITDEDLLLNNALELTMTAYKPRGENEAEWEQEAAANLIVEAHNQGVRDEEALAS